MVQVKPKLMSTATYSLVPGGQACWYFVTEAQSWALLSRNQPRHNSSPKFLSPKLLPSPTKALPPPTTTIQIGPNNSVRSPSKVGH
jgi:hypothetical protein